MDVDNDFLVKSLLSTKNYAYTSIWSTARNGLAPVNNQNRAWNGIFIPIKRYCAYSYYELLEQNKTVNAELYVQQMELLLINNSSFDARQCSSSYHQYDKGNHTNAWLGSADPPALFSELGANSFYIFRSLSNTMQYRCRIKSLVEFGCRTILILNRVISISEVLKVLLSVGRKLSTATENMLFINWCLLFKIKLLRSNKKDGGNIVANPKLYLFLYTVQTSS